MQAGNVRLREPSRGGIPHPRLPPRRMWRIVRWVLGKPQATNKLSVPYLEVNEDYHPPEWAKQLTLVPKERYGLAMLPTPIHPWNLPGLPEDTHVYIKRDDITGMQLSGNKVRKLEFLMADAKRKGHDCVVTIGGIQSNHCRATAVAARYLGLDTHLILRTSRQAAESDPGLVGNLLVDRMVGATIHLVTKEEYGKHGSAALGATLVKQLKAQGRNPYFIPVGGSNALGTWGYLQASEEIRQQCAGLGLTDIAMASGSGGTTAGLALGAHLAGLNLRVHAYGVCDDPDWFYNHIDGLLGELGASAQGLAARDLLRAVQAKGIGYAISTDEELRTIRVRVGSVDAVTTSDCHPYTLHVRKLFETLEQEVSESTGVLLDPVYSGKAVHALLQEIKANPEEWKGRRILFVHTGGLLGMYNAVDQLTSILHSSGGDGAHNKEGAGDTTASPDSTQYGPRVHRFDFSDLL